MKNLERITAILALLLLLTACGNGSPPDSKPLTDCRLGASKIGNCKL